MKTAVRFEDTVNLAALRQAKALTQTQAAELVHSSCRSWQQWEAGDRRMHPAFAELFLTKIAAKKAAAANDAAKCSPGEVAIKELRQALQLTQTQAAQLVHTTCRVWQQWEAGDRHMHPAFWELFQLKALK